MKKVSFIVGLGHVGLPLAVKIASLGRQVYGYDSNSNVVSDLRRGQASFYEKGLSDLLNSSTVQANFIPTESWEDVPKSDVIMITVGTPITSRGEPILSALDDCTQSLGKVLRAGQLVVYRSTIPPGTLRQRILPKLEQVSGLSAGKDFQLAYCPERLVEGVALREIISVPHIIGGINETSARYAAEFFDSLGCECVIVSGPEVAEMAKIMDNVYRDTNIALANEFSLACEELGIDVMESIRAANTSPRTKLLTPGCGVGGSCLNKDPYVLLSMMPSTINLSVVSSSRNQNESMPSIYAEFVAHELKRKNTKGIIALMGISFKAGTDDTRETITPAIAKRLIEKGFQLKAFDPLVSPEISKKLLPGVEIAATMHDAIRDSSAIVICSDHDEFRNMDLGEIRRTANSGCLLVDGRNFLDPKEVSKAGLEYVGLGRSISLN